MCHVVSRLSALQLVARGGQFGRRLFDRRRRAREIVLHFWYLQRREQLPFLNAIADIDLDLANVSGNLGHHIDFLKRLEFRGQDQVAGEIRALCLRRPPRWEVPRPSAIFPRRRCGRRK